MKRTMMLCACIVFLTLALTACGSATVAPAPPRTSSGGPSAANATPKAVPTAPANIPIMPGATDLDVSESSISYVIKSDLQKVIAFYEKELIAKGWKEDEKPSIIGFLGRMNFSNPDHQLSMILNYSETLNQVVIRMSIIYLNVVQPTPTP